MGQALELEYQLIINYPRLAQSFLDDELVSKVDILGHVSIRHFDTVSRTIGRLGGKITFPEIVPLSNKPLDLDLKVIFRQQLELEKYALRLHTEAAECVGVELAPQFRQLAKDEQAHIRLVEEILERLT